MDFPWNKPAIGDPPLSRPKAGPIGPRLRPDFEDFEKLRKQKLGKAAILKGYINIV